MARSTGCRHFGERNRPAGLEGKTFRAQLTKEQVRHSPDVDSTKPVSRQEEIAMNEYFGWPAYWGSGNPDIMGSYLRFRFRRAGIPGAYQGEPAPAKCGRRGRLSVWGTDGEIGRLENFIVDEASWHIGYLDVKTGDWPHSRSMLVPTRGVKSVSWAERRVNLKHARKEA